VELDVPDVPVLRRPQVNDRILLAGAHAKEMRSDAPPDATFLRVRAHWTPRSDVELHPVLGGVMGIDVDYADMIRNELTVMGEGFSDADRRKIAELRRLLPVFEAGLSTDADRKAARGVLPASARNMLKLRRQS
jgi:hypothetical protein